MERFARANGFHKDGDGRFLREDGSWIGKALGSCFPWERRTSSGDVVLRYLSKDHCLEMEPLVLEAEIWHLIEKLPENHALILTNAQGEPVEVLGTHLAELSSRQVLHLYPATYRLVVESGKNV